MPPVGLSLRAKRYHNAMDRQAGLWARNGGPAAPREGISSPCRGAADTSYFSISASRDFWRASWASFQIPTSRKYLIAPGW